MTSTINAKSTGVGGIDASGDASGVLALQTGGTTAVTIDASQNVGIGTASPTQKLDITNGRIAMTEVYDIRWLGTGNTIRGSITADSGSNLLFGTGSSNTERMRIDSSGNVGIGCIPIANTTNAQLQVGNGIGVVGSNTGINGNVYYASGWKYFGNGSGAQISLNRDATRAIEINVFANNTGGAGVAASLITAVDIDVSGNVGIGTNTPSSYGKLAVNGTISQIAAAGSYTIDITANSSSVANGGTVNFSNMSGMIIVNSSTSASIAIWLVSGGSTSAVSNVNGATGTMTYNGGIGGYTWTNNTGSSNTAAFFCVRTRNTA